MIFATVLWSSILKSLVLIALFRDLRLIISLWVTSDFRFKKIFDINYYCPLIGRILVIFPFNKRSEIEFLISVASFCYHFYSLREFFFDKGVLFKVVSYQISMTMCGMDFSSLKTGKIFFIAVFFIPLRSKEERANSLEAFSLSSRSTSNSHWSACTSG